MIKHLAASFWLALGAVTLAACATSATVSEADATEGISRDYDASYDVVKAAALQSVERLNVNLQGTDENDERFQIRFTKSISAFSWGEVGVVNVLPTDDGATVVVNTSKRSRTQITGTSEGRFAEEVFANIDESLAALQ
ncbi:MAG: hypothetical protein AAFR65_06300 [Pseudomonadota bacterium]